MSYLCRADREFPFLVGAGRVEITPPLEVGILMSAIERRWEPFKGVRLPLHARAVVIEKRDRRIAVVSMELIGLAGQAVGGMQGFKKRVAALAGRCVREVDLVLAATHTHSAPESLAITDLFHTAGFAGWLRELEEKLGAAVCQAATALQPCRLLAGSHPAPGLAIHRRVKTTRGIVLSHPVPPTDIVISRDGPVDDHVFIAQLVDRSGRLVALIVNHACHPVHEMCIPLVSPDFPGEMSLEIERRQPGSVALLFNGAAGNINPPTVSAGPQAAREHGHRLARLVEHALGHLSVVEGEELALCWRDVALPARTDSGQPAVQPLHARLGAIRIGKAVMLFLPGEPFCETALEIRKKSPWPFTAIVGYAEDYIGYIPTEMAFSEGGYETGPGPWSRVGPGSEPLVRKTSLDLLRKDLQMAQTV